MSDLQASVAAFAPPEDDWPTVNRILTEWSAAHYVQFVNRSSGQRSTDTVGRDALIDLIQAARRGQRDDSAALARQWADAREPSRGGDALRNFAHALMAGTKPASSAEAS